MTSNEEWKEALNAIEAFKQALDGRQGLSPEEKSVVFKEFVVRTLHSRATKNVPEADVPYAISMFSKNLAFAELLRKTGFKQHPDIVLLAVYDLMINKGYESVTTAEILKQYSDGLVKPSTNTSADVRQNRAKGYMMEADPKERKMSFKITMSGIEYVNEVLKNAGQ